MAYNSDQVLQETNLIFGGLGA